MRNNTLELYLRYKYACHKFPILFLLLGNWVLPGAMLEFAYHCPQPIN